MPGYDRSRFVGVSEEDLDEYICGICLEVVIKPTFTECCGKTYCYECINEWVSQNNSCPFDRKRLTQNELKSPPKMVINLLANMKIKCDFKNEGCKTIIKVNDLDKHKENECLYNPYRKCEKCGLSKVNHTANKCINELFKKLNESSVKFQELQNKQEKLIKEKNTILLRYENLYKENIDLKIKLGQNGTDFKLDYLPSGSSDVSGIYAKFGKSSTLNLLFDYSLLIELLLYYVDKEEKEYIQSLVIKILNYLMCCNSCDDKIIAGKKGIIDKMLTIIDKKSKKRVCDEGFKMAWSILWNVTDETPINCELLVNKKGISYIIPFMDSFADNMDLISKIMGLLANIAECAHLRRIFMKTDYIQRFINFLKSENNSFEIRFNSAAILSNIVSEGTDFWKMHLPVKCKRELIQSEMRSAINGWKINTKRQMSYSSFKTILSLMSSMHHSEAQYWGVWALANLTRFNSPKYCPLLIKEEGIEILENLIQIKSLPSHIRCLTILTLYQCHLFQKYGQLNGLEDCENINVPKEFLAKY